MCEPQTYCCCEAKRHLAKGMEIEEVRNTKVVAFILFQQCLWTSENDTITWSVGVFINE